MAHTYKYSILRLVPDPRRGESVNIGIVIFLDGKVDVRVLPALTKAKALGGNFDLQALYGLDESLNKLVARFSSVEEKYEILRQFSAAVVPTKLGWFMVENQNQYEQQVKGLIDQLVKPVARQLAKPTQTRLESEVRSMLKNRGILGSAEEDIQRHLVVPKYPVAPEENLFADFALKNSVFHIAETIDFRPKPRPEKFKEAALKAITLDKAVRMFGNETKRYVVYSADTKTEVLVQTHINLVSDYADVVLNMQSTDDRAYFVDQLMDAAGSNKSISFST